MGKERMKRRLEASRGNLPSGAFWGLFHVQPVQMEDLVRTHFMLKQVGEKLEDFGAKHLVDPIKAGVVSGRVFEELEPFGLAEPLYEVGPRRVQTVQHYVVGMRLKLHKCTRKRVL